MFKMPASAKRCGSTLARKAKGTTSTLYPCNGSQPFDVRALKIGDILDMAENTNSFEVDAFRGECYIRDARPLGGLSSRIVMLFLPNPKRRNSPATQQRNAIDLIVRSWKAKVESIRGNRIVFRLPVETRDKFVASGFWPMCHDA